MPVRLVIDASVAAKVYFDEPQSDRAHALVASGAILVAPDLLRWELANVAATRVARGGEDPRRARAAAETLADIIDVFVNGERLVRDAFRITSEVGCSAYDAAYLALASLENVRLVTADLRLAARSEAAGYDFLIRRL